MHDRTLLQIKGRYGAACVGPGQSKRGVPQPLAPRSRSTTLMSQDEKRSTCCKLDADSPPTHLGSFSSIGGLPERRHDEHAAAAAQIILQDHAPDGRPPRDVRDGRRPRDGIDERPQQQLLWVASSRLPGVHPEQLPASSSVRAAVSHIHMKKEISAIGGQVDAVGLSGQHLERGPTLPVLRSTLFFTVLAYDPPNMGRGITIQSHS